MNLCKMTREELITRCRELTSENQILQDELDNLSDCYTDMENQFADKICALDADNCIYDVNYFKYKLQLDDLLTDELESFIEDYLKFYNVVKG